jgi:DNA topoisomerase-6 subunit A
MTRRKRTGKKAKSRRRKANAERDDRTIALIESIASGVRSRIDHEELPSLELPVRGLSNVSYDPELGHFELGTETKQRTLSVGGVKGFAQTLRMMALCRNMVQSDDFATKREAYYVSKNWGECRFDEQSESDAVMDDIEALASREGISREQLRFYPESHGGSVSGELTIIDRDPETGQDIEIDCRRLGRGAYTIPRSVNTLRLETSARFALVIETGGMFQRLNNHRFWRTAGCILIEMGGVPSRATRRFVRRLSVEAKLPVYCFTDCDPYGFANIYRTLKAGSGNAAHVSRFLAVPDAQFLGVTPQDIIDYGLQDATHPLSKSDIKRARDAMANDPFFRAQPRWVAAIEQQLEMGVRAEQQALAKWGLNFVIDEYLPRKLEDPGSFLP